MEKNTVQKVKLGVFITIGILLLISGVFFIGDAKKMFTNTFKISANFKDINGLQIGNNVRFAGINVGTIESIEMLADTLVKVEMVIDVASQPFIKKNAKAVIGSDGLMGSKILNITPGSKPFAQIQDLDTIGTIIPVSLDDLMLKLKTTSDNAALITDDLASIVDNIRNGKGTIGKLFMDTIFAENLDKTIVNVKQGTKGFKQNMDAAQKSILLRGYFKK